MFTVERSYSSATMNGVTLIHQDPNNCSPNNSASNLTPITPLRQHRLSPSRLNNNANGYTKRGDTTFTTKEQDNKNKGPKSVKIWLLRGMMQVINHPIHIWRSLCLKFLLLPYFNMYVQYIHFGAQLWQFRKVWLFSALNVPAYLPLSASYLYSDVGSLQWANIVDRFFFFSIKKIMITMTNRSQQYTFFYYFLAYI